MSQTDFKFGWNERENNANPWEKNSRKDTVPKTGQQQDFVVDTKLEFVCNHVLKEIKAMTKEVRKVAYRDMSPSATEILRNGGGGEGTLLHGSDVPKKTSNFTIDIVAFRPAPEGFNSLGIVDIKPCFDCTAWALNKTNFKALMNKFGDNTDKWKGKVKLQVIQVRNPSNGTTGPSLAVAQ